MDIPLPDEISRWLYRVPGRARKVRVSQLSDYFVVHLVEMRRWPPSSPREHACLVAGAVGPTLSEALQNAARDPRIVDEEASE